jgi:chondroitin 4-sulfotransferase 11
MILDTAWSLERHSIGSDDGRPFQIHDSWDRLVSTYFYVRDGEGAKCGSEQRVSDYDDFRSFVRGWLTTANVWSSTHFKPQHYIICDENLRVQMDFLGRMEKIEADFSTLRERLSVKSELIRVNTGNHRHYTEYYTDELREKVASIYANDIVTFGYQFQE